MIATDRIIICMSHLIISGVLAFVVMVAPKRMTDNMSQDKVELKLCMLLPQSNNNNAHLMQAKRRL